MTIWPRVYGARGVDEMSTEQSLDPSLIEQTKQQIRTLVNEIAQLSKSDLSPEEFHTEFLPKVVDALAAIGGAIWTVDDQGRLALQYQINLQETKLRDSEGEPDSPRPTVAESDGGR